MRLKEFITLRIGDEVIYNGKDRSIKGKKYRISYVDLLRQQIVVNLDFNYRGYGDYKVFKCVDKFMSTKYIIELLSSL